MPTDPSSMVLDMLAETLVAINEDRLVDPVIIDHLARALDAHSAVSIYFDKEDAREVIAHYPTEAAVKDLLEYISDIGLDSMTHHVMVDHHQNVGHVVFVSIPPDEDLAPDGGFARLLAFARDAPYDEESGITLERACRPLTALWPQVARMYAKRRTTKGNCNLTSREREVLELLSQGLLATSIASRLNLSSRTVHKHLGNIYNKLEVNDRLMAVRVAGSSGILEAPTS
ncbi:MAG: LuxR C-terminal-related transcriptional regulator [Propionibacteriaceae bacterium]|nr:LuxR C-terminal-related transcriptional regulator [Propionibacteriaceae bacterium]